MEEEEASICSKSKPAPSPKSLAFSTPKTFFITLGMVGSSKIPFIALLLIYLGSLVKSDASDHRYSDGDVVPIYANKVGPYSNPRETYAYYDLPFCLPDVVKEKKLNLGEMLNGDHLVSTPYKLEFLVHKEFEVLCKKKLRKTDVSQLRTAIEKDYYTQLYYDDLPIWASIGNVERDYRDESINRKYFLYKHLAFEVFYNKDRVIEILLQVDPNLLADVTEDKEIDVDFTYSVRWSVTENSFDQRMEKYIGSSISVQGYSIANSCFTILILIICVLIYYRRVIRKEISKYACDIEENEVAGKQEETGWKNIHGDVFRFPKHKSLFAAALGSGTQLLVLMVSILILGVTGVFQPYRQGVFWNALVYLYAVTFVVSGSTSVSFYFQLEATTWMKNLLLAGGIHFAPLFLVFGFNNTVAIFYGSTAALPLGAIFTFSLLWIFVAFPLLLLGAVIGKNSVSNFRAPSRTAKCPREVPQLRWYKSILPQMAMAGFLPYSVISTQLYDILSSVFGRGIYALYNSMSIMFVLLLITTALVSVMLTYFQLAVEDHKWWWRSFFCGGSTGLYVYGYSIYYYFWLSDMNSFMQTTFFFGSMACLSYGIFLVLGMVGFHASLLFVRYLYASIKCDQQNPRGGRSDAYCSRMTYCWHKVRQRLDYTLCFVNGKQETKFCRHSKKTHISPPPPPPSPSSTSLRHLQHTHSTYLSMSATASHRPAPAVRRVLEPSTPPRLIPERGQVFRNVIRAVFSCLCFGERQRLRQRRCATVSPICP
ncbi:hypothetical protein L6452_13641 [Arctium lappa]|uniref:Uncharacterized protein n=1 Tax=Arctium lappa TaxID=4217 RepID=A0ACB9CIR6_ARCLA|nr:hypothetical protein L6452_13641 [Arctium lappa]